MKYCSQCGAHLTQAVPEGDDRSRSVCTSCNEIFYVNPKNVVGCVIEHERRLLLCRRAIEPRVGLWTVAGGYRELRETVVQGAIRETREEACAEVRVVGLHALLDIPHIGQSYVLFRAQLASPEFRAGIESQEVALFSLDDIPWEELAFPVIHHALRLYVEDRRRGTPRVHLGSIEWGGTGSRFDWRTYRLNEHRAAGSAESWE